ncbi:MAG: LL-diaminopimelate aminotransferase [Candidatus Omnitrophota bacterium]
MPKIERSERLQQLPPYLFAAIDQAKRKAREEGRDIIDLGVGDPDQPTPRQIIDKLYQAALNPANHHYALDAGMPALRQAIAQWFKDRFSVSLDPATEILPLIGSKEGLAHLPLGLVNPKDVVLIPEPSYPPYRSATLFAAGSPYYLALSEENNFLPQFNTISARVRAKAKLLFLNYPNNPTAATADARFFSEAVKFAQEHKILIAQDAAYSEITFDGYSAPSILQVKGAKDIAVEFYSLSKTYNMTGWRIGWACGNKEMIAALAQVKANIDSGIFQAIQLAGIEALNLPKQHLDTLNRLYQRRRDALYFGLKKIGWPVQLSRATFYVWAKLPKGQRDSLKFARLLLDQANIIVTPGIGFGPSGAQFVRFALTVPEERLNEAVERLKQIL